MKDLNVKDLVSKLTSAVMRLRRYAVLIFILVLVGVYGFLVYRINTLNAQEPTDEAVSEQLQTIKRPKIDKNALDKIEQLQGQNVEVKSLFDQARNNPFAE